MRVFGRNSGEMGEGLGGNYQARVDGTFWSLIQPSQYIADIVLQLVVAYHLLLC